MRYRSASPTTCRRRASGSAATAAASWCSATSDGGEVGDDTLDVARHVIGERLRLVRGQDLGRAGGRLFDQPARPAAGPPAAEDGRLPEVARVRELPSAAAAEEVAAAALGSS